MHHEERPTGRGGASGGLGPVRVASAVDEVADRLFTAIALGEFSVGERLPTERELALTLKVSRPTVRAAIARLRETGCLEVVRGRLGGHYVRAARPAESASATGRPLLPRWERTAVLFDTRGLIESLIARTAAERRDPTDIEAITAALEAYAAAAEPTQVRRADAALHHAITRAAKNEPLAVYSRQLLHDIDAGFPTEPYRCSQTRRALRDHRELVDAIVEGDPDRAATVARRHVALTGQTLREALEHSVDLVEREREQTLGQDREQERGCGSGGGPRAATGADGKSADSIPAHDSDGAAHFPGSAG
ncbi:FadR/GntR family transcriptional regulator [Streptomyces sp. MMS24-I2-30]|uniref:FadR/GntR family transcriptional regulator n=1 Tax=Streptomyces sp. MMS24-I2-30 TaxID=3351564 RepID=UPI0038969355